MDIEKLDIVWCGPKNSFSVEGKLSLEAVGPDTEPREVTITLEIPPTPNTAASIVMAKVTIKFERCGDIWYYRVVPEECHDGSDATNQWDSWLDELPSFQDPVPPVNPSTPEPPQQDPPTWTPPSLDDLLGDSPMWGDSWLDGLLWP